MDSSLGSATAAGDELRVPPAETAAGDPACVTDSGLVVPFRQACPRFCFCLFWHLFCSHILMFWAPSLPPCAFPFYCQERGKRRIYCPVPRVLALRLAFLSLLLFLPCPAFYLLPCVLLCFPFFCFVRVLPYNLPSFLACAGSVVCTSTCMAKYPYGMCDVHFARASTIWFVATLVYIDAGRLPRGLRL